MLQLPLVQRMANVADGVESPEDVLADLSPEDVSKIFFEQFVGAEDMDLIATGASRPGGAVSATVVFDRKLALELASEGIPYIYSVKDGWTDDFAAISGSIGFFTTNPAQTAFAPVQAVSENKPTVIGVAGHYDIEPGTTRRLVFDKNDGHKLVVHEQPRRVLRCRTVEGAVTEVAEGDIVSLDSSTGTLYRGSSDVRYNPVARFYALLAQKAEQAADAGIDLPDLLRVALETKDTAWSTEVRSLAGHPVVKGFELVKKFAKQIAALEIFATAHTARGVTLARVFLADIDFADGTLMIRPSAPGLGLVRDERMWNSAAELDLLRLLYLGEPVLGVERYLEVSTEYLRVHSARFASVFSAAAGAVTIVRTLCMPGNRLFSRALDVRAFAADYEVPDGQVMRAVERWDEAETYQGCRGMRLFICRPDIAELWLTAVLRGARESIDNGMVVRLRLLLATITFPAEARIFLDLLDRKAPEILGEHAATVLEGVSIMMETTGAYLRLEAFLAQAGRTSAVNGVMVGSNDFTAACLNFHREDSTRTIIPGFVDRGVLPHSPFQHLDTEIVGEAILTALRRARSIARANGVGQIWGLGGELAGDWRSVTWLATHAEPLGLRYVTTAAQNMIPALFAAAQVTATSLRHRPVPVLATTH